MDGTQDAVTVSDAVHNDADTNEVIDFIELATAKDHLLIDRVELLGPTLDLTANTSSLEVVFNIPNY